MSSPTESQCDLAVAAVLVLLAIYVFTESMGMPKGTFGIPGPGIWPLGLSVLLGAGAAGVGARAWLRQDDREVSIGTGHVGPVILALLFVALAFEHLGFAVTTALFLVTMFRNLSGRSWRHCAVAGIATTAGLYAIFHLLIGVSLPTWDLAWPG